MAIPMTMLFMFFSQILYIALLSFNHIQAIRYQGMIDYYRGQIQLMMALPLVNETTSKVTQLEAQFAQAVNKNNMSFTKIHSKMIVVNNTPQIQIYQLSDQSKIVLIQHQVYLSDYTEQMDWESQWILSGTLDKKRLPINFQHDRILEKITAIKRQLLDQGYRLTLQNRSGSQGTINIYPQGFNYIVFNQGDVQKQNGEQYVTLYSTLNEEQLVYKKELSYQKYDYFIRSQCYVYEKND